MFVEISRIKNQSAIGMVKLLHGLLLCKYGGQQAYRLMYSIEEA